MALRDNDPPEHEWLTPSDSIVLLSGRFPNPEDAKFAIVHYAATGGIRARCRQGTTTSDLFMGGSDEKSIANGTILKREFWVAFTEQKNRISENWVVSAFSARGVYLGKNALYTYTVRIVGVEFHLGDLMRSFEIWNVPPVISARLAGEASPESARAPALPKPLTVGSMAAHLPRARANPVTNSEIRAWYRALAKADKTLGVLALWARAKADHPGRHLPRKLVEQFGAGRSNGHRAKG